MESLDHRADGSLRRIGFPYDKTCTHQPFHVAAFSRRISPKTSPLLQKITQHSVRWLLKLSGSLASGRLIPHSKRSASGMLCFSILIISMLQNCYGNRVQPISWIA